MLIPNAVPSDVIGVAILDKAYKPGSGRAQGEDDHAFLCNLLDDGKYVQIYGHELIEDTKAVIADAIAPHYTLSIWYAHKFNMVLSSDAAMRFWAGLIIDLKSEGR